VFVINAWVFQTTALLQLIVLKGVFSWIHICIHRVVDLRPMRLTTTKLNFFFCDLIVFVICTSKIINKLIN
jgi:hypothetical protein